LIDKIWKCEVCGEIFTQKRFYNQHIYNKEKCAEVYLRGKIENIDYIECKICGYKTMNIGNHLKTEHNINSKDYKKIYNSNVRAKILHENYKKTCLDKYGVANTSGLSSTIDKRKQTNLKRYGTEWAINNENIKSRVEKTNLERYGCISPFGNANVREKIIQTFIQNYGVENPFKAEEVKDKIKQTNLDRYGTEYSLQAKEVKDKIKQTNLDRYGTEYYTQTEEYKKRREETCLKKYGCINNSQTEEWLDKIKQTNLDRYGTEYYSQTEEYKKRSMETLKNNYGIYSTIVPGFSLNSQELFTSIELILLDLYPDLECFYATNKKIEIGKKIMTNEYQVLVNSVSNTNTVRYLDFYIPILKKWIEFDEKKHRYTLDDDKIREQEIKTIIPDIQLLRINDEDYLNNKDATVENCIKFILD